MTNFSAPRPGRRPASFWRKALLGLLMVVVAFALFRVLGNSQPLKLPSPAIGMLSTPTEQTPLSFIAFGDNGSGLSGQYKLAAEMLRQYKLAPYSFALMLGDNIYPSGDIARYGQERFQKPYGPLLDLGVRFWPALGNHDVVGGHQAEQIAFFKMPGEYYDFVQGPIHFYALNTNHFDAPQAQWLTQRLAKSPEAWKIVYAHHPVFSSGLHGSNRQLMRGLKPILEQHHVTLYLTGHDHDYERFQPVNGVHYLVSGGGGASLRRFYFTKKGSLVRRSKFHFLRFTLTEQRLHFEAIDSDGLTFDSGDITQVVPTPSAKAATRAVGAASGG